MFVDDPLAIGMDQSELSAKYDETEDQNDVTVVVLQSDGDAEEYELYEIYDECTTDKIKNDEEQLHYEIVEGDDQNIHCRVVNTSHSYQLDEHVDYIEPTRSSRLNTKKNSRQPVQIDLPQVNVPEPVGVGELDEKQSEADLLNKSNMSEKDLHEFIQTMIHSAEPNDEGKYVCSLCKETVSNRYSLGPHVMRVHSKQRNKVCPFCDRAFTCTGDLTRHIRIHTKSKPFKCNYPNCEYAFRASGDLHKHVRRHQSLQDGSNRRFACDLCDRSFERNYDLKRHKMTHNRDKEGVGYPCEYCAKTFVRKVSPNTHQSFAHRSCFHLLHFHSRINTKRTHIDISASNHTNVPTAIERSAISPIAPNTLNRMRAKMWTHQPLVVSRATFV